jgi:hypothetical protein
MKKIIDLIKSLLGGGSMAEKAVELKQLESAVKDEITEVKSKIVSAEQKVKDEVAAVETKVKKAVAKKPKVTK